MATTFNIGTQNAANINNVGGDAHIERVDATASFEIDELRASIASAQDRARGLELPVVLRDVLDDALDSAAAEAAKAQPDRRRLAGLLGAAARVAKQAGTVASGCTAVIDALRQAAVLLGPLGHAALALAAL